MNTKIVKDIAIINSDEMIIKDVQSAIDFIMTIKYETNCSKIALNKNAIIDFIYESNNEKDIFFVANEDEAIKMLSK